MKSYARTAGILAFSCMWTSVLMGQVPPPATQPSGEKDATRATPAQAGATAAPSAAPTTPSTHAPASAPSSQPAADETVATVNGHPILSGEVDNVCRTLISRRMGGTPVSDAQVAQFRMTYALSVLDMLIETRLLDEAAEKAGVKVTDEEMTALVTKELQDYLKSTGTTRAELDQEMRAKGGKPLDEYLAARITAPDYRRKIAHQRLIEGKFTDEVKVSDQEVADFYQTNLDRYFKQPEMVRASQILILTHELKTDEEKATARKKAEEVLAEAKKPDADFAALARQHSEHPSAANGGDLDYFPRESKGVDPFSEAAFALKVGEISGIVESEFGYHIIKVTGRKEAKTFALDDVQEAVRGELKNEKISPLRERLAAELKASARIEYAAGMKPPLADQHDGPTSAPTAQTPSATTQPTTEPAPAASATAPPAPGAAPPASQPAAP